MFNTEQVIEYLLAFMIAFLISFSATPIAKVISRKIGAIDVPNDDRRMHTKPLARSGGLAIIAGFMASVLFLVINAYFENLPIIPLRQLIGIFSGALIVAAVGIIDDIKRVDAKIKFLVQAVAAVCVVVIGGMRIEYLTNPFIKLGYSRLPLYISYPLTILWIMAITNAVNLIDGLDGLAAGTTAISCISLFIITLLINKDAYFAPMVAVMALALAGSATGFLPFNFHPAKIIMGDSGAYFMGFILGTISIQGALKSYTAISISIPIIVLGLPLFDTTTAFLRRIFNKQFFMRADRKHIHHKLIDMGLSHKQAVIVMYTATAALGLSAIVMANKGPLSAIILMIIVAVFVVGGAFFMKDINIDEMPVKNAETIEKQKDNPAAQSSIVAGNVRNN